MWLTSRRRQRVFHCTSERGLNQLEVSWCFQAAQFYHIEEHEAAGKEKENENTLWESPTIGSQTGTLQSEGFGGEDHVKSNC